MRPPGMKRGGGVRKKAIRRDDGGSTGPDDWPDQVPSSLQGIYKDTPKGTYAADVAAMAARKAAEDKGGKKRGGRIEHERAGAGSGEGRLDKTKVAKSERRRA
jgi:hypothetical protein